MPCNKRKAAEKNEKLTEKGLQDYPGVAIDAADDNKVDSKLVKERTSTLNNNPRNTDM